MRSRSHSMSVQSLSKSELVTVVLGLLQADQAEVVQQAVSTLLLATHEQKNRRSRAMLLATCYLPPIENHAAEEPLADCISVFTF